MDSEAFADSTTKKKDIPYQSKQPGKGSFSDVTTKKGKNLRDLEADPLFESVPTFAEADRAPLPVQPQPPVAAKVTPPPAIAVPAGLSHPPRLASPAASSPALPALQTAPAVSASQPDLGGVSEVIRAVAASDPPSSPERFFSSHT